MCAIIDFSREAIARLRAFMPEMQKPCGMMRQCEILLLADIAKDMELYLSMGCGPHGVDMLESRSRSDTLRIVGIEQRPPQLDFSSHRIEYHQADIFTPEVASLVESLLKEHSPCLVYTDNGCKLRELQLVAPFLKPGDIVGTHDYQGEVPENKVGFLHDSGCTLYETAEPWIQTHLCWQRFWVKTSCAEPFTRYTGATVKNAPAIID